MSSILCHASEDIDSLLRTKKTILSGFVKRKGNHKGIADVAISIKGTTLNTETDTSGYYILRNIPIGNCTLLARKVGYKLYSKPLLLQENSNKCDLSMEEDKVMLDEVVVSANREETIKRLSPALVNVLSSKLYDTTQSTCLAQGLNFQPGVRTEDNCQNCGYTQVRINGLDGHYSQVLIDSRPVFSALNGVYGLEQIPANMIDRVEVIRGGGSALYGASAIGGVINIITKEPVSNFAEFGHSIMSIDGRSCFQNNTTMNASVISDDRKTGLYIYGESHHRPGFDYDHDGYTEMPLINGQTVGFRSFVKTGTYSKLSFQYDNIKEFRRGGNNLSLPAHESNITEQIDHDINGGGLNFDLYSPVTENHLNTYLSFQNTDRKSYYGGIGDGSAESVATALKSYGKTHDITVIGGSQYTINFNKLLFMPSVLTTGLEYNFDGLQDHALGYGTCTKQYVNIYSALLQNEWKTDQWGFLLGGRFDKHSLVNHVIFSPRINIRYNPSHNMNFRLSLSTGFRAPQTFDEDLHISVSGGERIKIYLAHNLQEEKSYSLSASADLYHQFGNVQTNLLIEGFYTDLSHVFSERYLPQPDPDGNKILERYNGTGARVAGTNMEGKATFSQWFQLQAGMTLQQSKYNDAEQWSTSAPAERKMFRTPNTYGYFTSTFTPVKDFSASLSGTYTGHMLVQHVKSSGTPVDLAVKTPTFMDVNVKLSYDFHLFRATLLQLYGGIQNVTNAYQKDFDKGYNRDSNYIYGPASPRSFYTGIKMRF
ncbi:MAG: TonB-dependent receptor [Prevotella sp.]|jgi:outer membrane receptor for ferrienterochelin and colicins|nr:MULTISPECIES: TonB-dependent receptor [unclassified Prevotella]MCH3970121.1 TonB-dependent receptor [Prevotella sp.]MCH3984848.1 TonB-dependent receptor [Prevotella sp.]MCH4016885.1 TonB-dependent receptor [Prevotella sp.]MCH4099075.1 TonB-dependent receptor [Prevotella sp.]MCH4186044.1 TonB-dependent receptor [Prevotella sp.]